MESNTKKVSIIIPVFNKWDYTEMCLKSVRENTDGIDYEIIVVDDCSTDEMSKRLLADSELIYLRNERNIGFIKSCNKGASHATGEILIFLNNDTEVNEGWLSALLETFYSFDDAGIVGSKLLNSDETLQEAGGIIWNDGSGWNFGRGNDPTDWQYNYVREVDYVSGACLAIKRDVWNQCSGFDELYTPAYYEDSDLCFSVRELGYKVYYQPRSIVIHHEGITSGKSVDSGVKKHQVTNMMKFRNKWKTVLESKHWFPDPAFAVRAKLHSKKPTVLIVDSIIPERDKDSGSVRMTNIVLLLMKKGFGVTLFSDSKPNSTYAMFFMNLGVEVVEQTKHFEDFIKERVLQFDLIWLARPGASFQKLDVVRKYIPNAKVIYDTIDLYFVRTRRQSEIEQNEIIAMNAEVYQAEELYLSRNADLPIVVTNVEKEVLNSIDQNIEPIVIPNIHQIPELQIVPYKERRGLMFLGGYRHPPNVDAVIWFVDQIFPLVREHIGDIVLFVIGSHPPEEIEALHKDGEVEVVGWVEDLDPWFSKARVFVSPLRYGAGMKGKIGQAMSYGVPMVTTSIGAEGMNLAHRTNAMIADSPRDFANALIELYKSQELWQKLSLNSVKHIKQSCSPDQVERKMEQLYIRLFGSNNPDDFIRSDIQKQYVLLSQKNDVMELKKAYLLNVLKQGINRPIFIWGAGYFGKRSLVILREIDVNVEGFIDSDQNRHGETIDSRLVYSPDILINTHINKPFIVIGVSLPYCTDIEAQLNNNGYDKERDFCRCQDFVTR
jgi:GT2 family glycosyltransferase